MMRWIRLKAITLAVADINYRIFTIGGPRRGLEMLRYTLPLFVRMVGRALTNRPFGLTEKYMDRMECELDNSGGIQQ